MQPEKGLEDESPRNNLLDFFSICSWSISRNIFYCRIKKLVTTLLFVHDILAGTIKYFSISSICIWWISKENFCIRIKVLVETLPFVSDVCISKNNFGCRIKVLVGIRKIVLVETLPFVSDIFPRTTSVAGPGVVLRRGAGGPERGAVELRNQVGSGLS